jgi:cell division protein FtsW
MKEKFIKYFKGDTAIWIIIFMLSIVSMLVVWSATGALAYKKMAGSWHYLFKHGGFLLFGIAVIYVVHNVSYKFFFTFSHYYCISVSPC